MKVIKKSARKSTRLLVAFILGQAVQVILHAVCLDYWEQYQIPFCVAGGLLVAVAVFAGVRMAYREFSDAGTHWEDMQ